MSIKDIASPEALASAAKFIENIQNGTIRKRLLPYYDYGEFTELTNKDLNVDLIKLIDKHYNRREMATKESIKIMVGHSGSGKNFLPELFGLKIVPGCTTRAPRPNDVGYTFYNKEDFAKIDKSRIVCKTNYMGNDYWMFKKDFENPAYNYAVVDLNGVRDLEAAIKDNSISRPVQFIFYKSSFIKRFINMRRRKDSWSKIRQRLFGDLIAFKGAEKYIKSLGGKVLEL